MANSIDRIDQVHNALLGASGRQFFQRLRDYSKVLTDDRKIRRAIRRIRRQANRANNRFLKHDKKSRRELKRLRDELVEAAPDADDSDRARPSMSGTPAPPASADAYEWSNTLANFDAVCGGRPDRIIQTQGLDNSRSGIMAAILDTKLIETRWPLREHSGVLARENNDQRPGLDQLHRRVKDARQRQHHAYLEMEKTLETSGYIGLLGIDNTVAELDPAYRPMVTDKERESAFSQTLRDVSGRYHVLRQAVRPSEVQDQPSQNEEDALNFHEEKIREAVERFEAPLRIRLNRDTWLPQPTTTQAIAIVSILVTIAIAVVGWLFFTPSS